MSEHQTVFISYGNPDESFAQRLVAELESRGVHTWFFPRDAVPGQKLHSVMREGIASHDRVIAICSEAAFQRHGFQNELEQTFTREAREGGSSILIPITIDDFLFSPGQPMEGGFRAQIVERVAADFRKALLDKALFEGQVESIVRALAKARSTDPPERHLMPATFDPPTQPTPEPGPKPTEDVASLDIEYRADVDPYFMRWDNQVRTIRGNEYRYTHRVFRVGIRNTSRIKTVRGAQVILQSVTGVHSRHASVLPGHRLRAMDHDTAEVNINPGTVAYFDVASHDLEPELNAIEDLKFRYAEVEKESLPTDPGTWWDISLQAQGIDVAPAEGFFRLSVDGQNVAHLDTINPPETRGIEPSFERRKPFEDDDHADADYDRGGRIFRVGLRSRDPNEQHLVTVVVESFEGGIEGVLVERPLRFKDSEALEKAVPFAPRACVFVDVLKYPVGTRGAPTILYAQEPRHGDDVKLTNRFSLTLRIMGGPRAVHMTLFFIPDILGFPQLLTYKVA